MSGLGKAMAGGGAAEDRQKDDFYPTPRACTLALLKVEREHLQRASWGGKIWEPACGDGAISKVLIEAGLRVVSTDLVDRGYGDMRADFFSFRGPLGNAIITNPPFAIAEAFIRKSRELKVDYLALLLKSTYWHAAERFSLYNAYKPAAVYPLTWRPDFLGLGAPTMESAWMVWRSYSDGRCAGETIFRPLPKPIEGGLDLAA